MDSWFLWSRTLNYLENEMNRKKWTEYRRMLRQGRFPDAAPKVVMVVSTSLEDPLTVSLRDRLIHFKQTRRTS